MRRGSALVTFGWSLLLGVLPSLAPAQDGYLVVVHPSNPVATLTSDELSSLFLRTSVRWPHGELIEPVDLDPADPVRDRFSVEIHGRPVMNISSYWQQQVFSGGKVPPLELADPGAVVALVRERPGAIGYVGRGTDTTGVKVVPVVYAPRRIHFEPPTYTLMARRARVQGDVVLELTVDPEGTITKVEVISGLPHGLTQQAVAAARRWRFEPASRQGVPVEATIEYRVHFSL